MAGHTATDDDTAKGSERQTGIPGKGPKHIAECPNTDPRDRIWIGFARCDNLILLCANGALAMNIAQGGVKSE